MLNAIINFYAIYSYLYDALIECHQNGDNEYIQRYLMKNCNIIHATTENVQFCSIIQMIQKMKVVVEVRWMAWIFLRIILSYQLEIYNLRILPVQANLSNSVHTYKYIFIIFINIFFFVYDVYCGYCDVLNQHSWLLQYSTETQQCICPGNYNNGYNMRCIINEQSRVIFRQNCNVQNLKLLFSCTFKVTTI